MDLRYVWERNQMQKSLFIQKQSREPGDQKSEVQNGRQKSSQTHT